ncbi:ribonuclease III domain-containing protein [Hirsutella rhossiliensis]|uniref:Ribonuclease III domain-containing protein n=1 Tax=Hirsutella rhossiliensis TaxID=111463 RepID=A0A9P8N7A7_9HYPO|nr:ribonuclease III domain-containing protein [Hirsutella rhossiliensis]KAH0967079.1 ribonuclease III domain-containing protein [Hirsutella rhossiliensis]
MTKRPASSLETGESLGGAEAPSKRKCSTESAGWESATPAGEVSTALDRAASGLALPSLVAVTPWISSEISSDLPPLPKILDPELEEVAFTHPGLGLVQNYERLEWLGDAYLELIASSLIYQTFGRTPSGRCSQLRELLIRNTTLAQYFRQYDMHLRAKLPSDLVKSGELGRGRSSDKDQLKTQGDMFEAYVAAVIVSDPQNGLANVVCWLKTLWGHTIRHKIVENEKLLSGLPPSNVKAAYLAPGARDLNAKDRLRAIVGAKGVSIRYEDIPGNSKHKDFGMPLFTVGVYLDGWGEKNKLLGTGTAMQKKEAGHKAATMALENKKLMKLYGAKKEAFQEALQEAARTAESVDEQGPAS